MGRIKAIEQIRKNIDALIANPAVSYPYIPVHPQPSPSVAEVQEVMQLLRRLVFPGFFGPSEETESSSAQYYTGVYLEHLSDILHEQIFRSMVFEGKAEGSKEDAEARAVAFINELPRIKYLLSTDVKAILDGDPAAKSLSEIIFCYPAIRAMLYQRSAHALFRLNVPILPRIITELAHSATGIDIHPGAQIGEYFSIDHGTGVVIGQTTIIGNHVRLYQGVTLGAKSFTLDEEGLPMDVPRHPILEDNVTVYSNTSVLGRIVIGHDTVIGGNIWLTHSVPPYSKVLQGKAQEGKYGLEEKI